MVANAPDALEHKLNRLTDGVDVTHDTHKVTQAIEVLLGIIAQAPKAANLKIDQLMLRMSRTFGLPTERLNERLEEVRKARSRAAAKRRDTRPSAARPTRSAPSSSGSHSPSVPRNENAAPPQSFDPNAAFLESAEFEGDFGGYDDFGAPPDFGGSSGFGEPNNFGTTPDRRSSSPNRPEPLSGMDRELFETLIESPELAAMAVESIDPDWLESNTAKMLLSAYQDLDLEGRDLTLESLMLVLENDDLKNQVVTLEERVRRREGHSTQTTVERYAGVVLRYREREFSAEKNRQIAKLASSALAEDEEEALLKELFDAERTRHQMKKE